MSSRNRIVKHINSVSGGINLGDNNTILQSSADSKRNSVNKNRSRISKNTAGTWSNWIIAIGTVVAAIVAVLTFLAKK